MITKNDASQQKQIEDLILTMQKYFFHATKKPIWQKLSEYNFPHDKSIDDPKK